MLRLLKYFKNNNWHENKRVIRRYIPNCFKSVHNNNFVLIVCTITYIGCILIDILNIYIKNISNQWIEWKTSHKPTVNWDGKGWKIHQMKVIFTNVLCFRLRLSRVPYLKTTRRGWQGAANGLPTHLAGGMSRLIISLKRYLESLLLAFYTDALSIIYTLFVLWFMLVINTNQSISATR